MLALRCVMALYWRVVESLAAMLDVAFILETGKLGSYTVTGCCVHP